MAKVFVDGKEVGEVERFERNDAGRPSWENLAPADPKRFLPGRVTFDEPVILGNYDPEPGPDSLEDWQVREVPKATGLLWSFVALGFLFFGLGVLFALFWL